MLQHKIIENKHEIHNDMIRNIQLNILESINSSL